MTEHKIIYDILINNENVNISGMNASMIRASFENGEDSSIIFDFDGYGNLRDVYHID